MPKSNKLTYKSGYEPLLHMSVRKILRETNKYIWVNKRFSLCIFVINFVYMLLFKSIDGGISNPLSIVWAITYYMFWCAFYRYYYNLRPYVFSRKILGSLAPSTKAVVLMFLVFGFLVILPLLPLFFGCTEEYLNYYERYMESVENLGNNGDVSMSFVDIFIIYGILALFSPCLICNPYMAWISSLRGRDALFRKVHRRTRGNYIGFVIISAILLYPEALARNIDIMFHLQDWFHYTVSTIIFVYTNILFAKMYDFFYLKH